MPQAARSIIVNTTPETLFKVITDYERYPEFLKESRGARVAERSEGVAVVDFEVDMIKRVRYRLRLEETPFKEVRWSLVSGFFKKNEGCWMIEDLEDGRVKATYRVEIELGLLFPRSILKTLTEVSLPAMLESFKKRAESFPEGG